MPGSSLGLGWAVIAIMASFLMMAAGVIASIVIHGKRTRESESRFRLMFNSAIDANILIDGKNRILDVNKSACSLLGYSRKDLLRASFEDLVPKENSPKFRRDIGMVIESGLGHRGEGELRCKDGSTILVEFGGSRMMFDQNTCFIGSFRDITERKRAEGALKESEERYRAVWEYSPVGICLTDKDGIYHYANPAYCRIYGYSEKELIGSPYYELIMNPEESKGRRERYNKLFEEGKPILLGETEFIRKDRKSIWIQYTGDFVRENGKPKYMVSMNIDITEQKRIQQALNEERRLLEEKNATLKEIFTHLEEEKLKIRREVAESIERGVMPALNRVIRMDGTVNRSYFNMIKKNLSELMVSTGGIRLTLSKLTPREAEICDLLISGASSKEISKTLSLSLLTVNSHRRTIRRKLVISNKNINLSSFLRNLRSDG
jgi:PAS domain S-box-containing protein